MLMQRAGGLCNGSRPGGCQSVVWLEEAGTEHADLLGPKAWALAGAIATGFAVPAGFCVTAQAYRDRIAAAGLRAATESLTCEALGAQGCRAALAQIRRAISEMPLPKRLRDEIAQCWERLGGGPVAVRSSATAEDLPGRSFAGQHDSFLGLSDLDAILQGIKDCWASLWSERAYEYRRNAGVDGASAAMAVIVQRLVPATASGVMFTIDPVSGRRDCAVIEGSWGLGLSVVAGQVRPDRIVVSKRVFRVEQRATGQKESEIVAADGGTRLQPVDAARAARPCVDDLTACWLGHLGARLESLFGAPQDVEWAIADGRIHLLQSRPITVLPDEPRRSWEDRQVWADSNLREAAPDPLAPMSWSFMWPAVKQLFQSMIGPFGIHVDMEHIAGLVGGRVYFNVNVMAAVARALRLKVEPGPIFGGGGPGNEAPIDVCFPKADLPRVCASRLAVMVHLPLLAAKLLWRSGSRGQSVLAQMRAEADALDARDVVDMDERQLPREIQAALASLGYRVMAPGGPLLVSGLGSCMALGLLCRHWLQDDTGEIASRLLSGMGGLDDAEAGIAVWRLAETAHRHPFVAKAVAEEDTFDGLRRRIENEPGGARFLSQWAAFMRDHGHHAKIEIEPANPRWSETPGYVLGLVRACLMTVGSVDPVERAHRLAEERTDLEQDCLRRLRNPVKRMLFRAVVRRAQEGLRFRENSKSTAIRWIAALRRLLLELGGRLAHKGAICRSEDIFFIELGELDAVVSGRHDARPLVIKRRAEHARNLAVRPPTVVFGVFDPQQSPTVAPGDRNVVMGLAVSPGVVTGKARVITHEQADYVRPGEVLVASITDPGWTPHLVAAAGIVIEQGGLLSHGSILAREYGIPCVANVGPLGESVRTGQTIRVDGTHGTVTILDSSEGGWLHRAVTFRTAGPIPQPVKFRVS